MTKDRHRLVPAVQLAQRRQDAAGCLLGQWEARVRQHGLQLEELHRYRREYREQWERRSAEGLAAFQLRDYQLFLERLDAAIRAQELRLAELHGQRDRHHREWLTAHARTEVLERVIERDRAVAMRRQERREQAQADERAQRGSPFDWER
jgi:flagellar FliJ protein